MQQKRLGSIPRSPTHTLWSRATLFRHTLWFQYFQCICFDILLLLR